MTSKNLFFKLLKEDFKQRVWSFTITILILFFSLPVATATIISSYDQSISGITFDPMLPERRIRYLRETIFGLLSTENKIFDIVLIGLTILIAVSGFIYLYKKQRTDFYHALPVKREIMYSVVVLDGILIIAIPYFIFNLISGLILAMAIADITVIGTILSFFLIRMMGIILCFMTVVLAITLTGNALISIFGTIFFYGYLPFVILIREGLYSSYYLTYIGNEEALAYALKHSSPVSYMMFSETQGFGVWIKIICLLLWSVTLFFIGMILHKKRKSEYAGRAMAFKITQTPIKFLMVIPFGLVGALFMRTIMENIFWVIFGMLCGTIISHCVIEIIYHSDFKKIFANIKHMGIAILVCMGVLLIFYFDLTGFETYFPKEAQLEAIGIWDNYLEIHTEELYQNLKVERDKNGNPEWVSIDFSVDEKRVIGDTMKLTDYHSIQILVNEGMEYIKNRRMNLEKPASYLYMEDITEEIDGEYIERKSMFFTYHLKNGKKIRRKYFVDVKKNTEVLENIYNSQEYKQAVYPILSRNSEEIEAINYYAPYSAYHKTLVKNKKDYTGVTEVGDKKIQELVAVYREELLGLQADTRNKENPIGNIRFCDGKLLEDLTIEYTLNYEDTTLVTHGESFFNSYRDIQYYPIYPSFTKTIALLESMGCEFINPLMIEDIAYIEMKYSMGKYETSYGYDKYMDMGEETVLTISDTQDITKILENTYFADLLYTNLLGGMEEYQTAEANVVLKRDLISQEENAEDSSDPRASYHTENKIRLGFINEEVPVFD